MARFFGASRETCLRVVPLYTRNPPNYATFLPSCYLVAIGQIPNLFYGSVKRLKPGLGFTLRNDNKRFAHAGMLDLLRDVFNSDTIVEVEYFVDPGEFGKINGIIHRVTRRK